jgi:hypothetical protein
MVRRPAARLTRNFIFRVAVPRLTGLAYNAVVESKNDVYNLIINIYNIFKRIKKIIKL